MTETMTRERRIAVDPHSPESLEQFADKTHEEAERREKAEGILDKLDAEGKNQNDVRILREALANGELNQAPRVEVEEPGMEAAA